MLLPAQSLFHAVLTFSVIDIESDGNSGWQIFRFACKLTPSDFEDKILSKIFPPYTWDCM